MEIMTMSLKEGTVNSTNLLFHLIIWPLLTLFLYRFNSLCQLEYGNRCLAEIPSQLSLNY